MATKIDAYSPAALGGQTSAVRPAETGKAGAGQVAKVSRSDSVKLTPDAMQLHQLEKTIAAIPVADHERVAKVRQAISNGSYKIDSKAIATKLTRMQWDLARTR